MWEERSPINHMVACSGYGRDFRLGNRGLIKSKDITYLKSVKDRRRKGEKGVLDQIL